MDKPGFEQVKLPGGSTDAYTAAKDLVACLYHEIHRDGNAPEYLDCLRRAKLVLEELQRFW